MVSWWHAKGQFRVTAVRWHANATSLLHTELCLFLGWYHQEEDGEKYYFTVENDTVCDPLITDERCWKRLLISSMFNQNSWGLVCGPVECQTWVIFMKQVRLGRFVARWHSNAHHRCPGRGKHGRITGSAWHGGREVGLLQQQQAAGRSC